MRHSFFGLPEDTADCQSTDFRYDESGFLREETHMRNIKWSEIFTALIFAAGGVYLYLYPATSNLTIAQALAVVSAVLGLIRVVSYLVIDLGSVLFRNDFVEGVVFIMLGGLIWFNASDFAGMVPYLLSGLILLSGFSKIQDAIDAHRMGFGRTAFFLILALVCLVLGGVVLFNLVQEGRILSTLCYLGLVYSGISDLICAIYLSAKIARFRKDARQRQQAALNQQNEAEITRRVNEQVEARLAEEKKKQDEAFLAQKAKDEVQKEVVQVEQPKKKSLFSFLQADEDEDREEDHADLSLNQQEEETPAETAAAEEPAAEPAAEGGTETDQPQEAAETTEVTAPSEEPADTAAEPTADTEEETVDPKKPVITMPMQDPAEHDK